MKAEVLSRLMLVGFNGFEPDADAVGFLETTPPSGIILFKQNVQSQNRLRAVLADVQKRCAVPDAPPLLIGIDQEGGRVVRLSAEVGFRAFPSARELAASTNSEAAVREAAASTARGLRDLGINMNFAPVLDVVTDPDNRVIGDRSYGDNPEIVERLGLMVIEEHQSRGVAATAKHFPGHGPTSVDSHMDLPVIAASSEELERNHLKPFRAAASAGVAAVMTAHAVYPCLDGDRPATLSRTILTDLLRESWGYNGVICTDSLTMQAIARRQTVPEACVRAIEAGADLLMVPSSPPLHRECVAAIQGAVAEGRLSANRIQQSLDRVMRMREQFRQQGP